MLTTMFSISAGPSSVKLENKGDLCFLSRQAEVQYEQLSREAN